MDNTSASLLERLREGTDEEAWTRFVTLYSPLLGHWVRRLGLQGSDAEDLIQDIFGLLVEKLPEFRYDPQKRFRGWLWTLTLNRWRENRRCQAAKGPPISERELAALATPDDTLAFDEQEYRQYLVKRALRLMQTDFEPTTWQAFWEYVANDRPAAEVAAELGISIEGVYAAKSRVLRRLRHELEGLLD